MSTIKKVAENTNFTAVNVGNLNQLGEHNFMHPLSGQKVEGKVFLKDAIKSTGSEISYNILPPQTGLPFLHIHKKNEEVYMILKGSGFFQVDDECVDILEGSIIRVAPAGKRGMTNTSDEPMIFIIIQAKEGSLEEYTFDDGSRIEQSPLWMLE